MNEPRWEGRTRSVGAKSGRAWICVRLIRLMSTSDGDVNLVTPSSTIRAWPLPQFVTAQQQSGKEQRQQSQGLAKAKWKVSYKYIHSTLGTRKHGRGENSRPSADRLQDVLPQTQISQEKAVLNDTSHLSISIKTPCFH